MGFETYTLPSGKIMIAFSDKSMSAGTLHINPGQELPRHNRPALESLYQLQGVCVMKLFDNGGTSREVIMKEGDSIEIPPGKFHIHSNPHECVSITFWKASGDITHIIEDIRKNNRL